MPVYTPALDLIINRADKTASGLLSLSGPRVLSSPSSSFSSSSSRIIAGDQGNCRIRLCEPNLTGERAFDDVDLSLATVRIALGVIGGTVTNLVTLSTPFPSAAAAISTVQSATADLPATKRITLAPAPYGGSFLVTLAANPPFEIPWDAEQGQVTALAGKNYTVKKRGTNVWEISGTEPAQDVTIAVDVTGLLVPIGVTGRLVLNTNELAAAFTASGNPRFLKLALEVEAQFPAETLPRKLYQGTVEVARALLDLSTLVPLPLPPSDVAAINAALAGKAASSEPVALSHAALANNPHGVTKAQVGLGNANNTSDAAKPVSTAQAAADTAVSAAAAAALSAFAATLDNVDNTADADKPVSTAQAAADTAVSAAAASDLSAFAATLDNVDNTSDADKPVSTAQAAADDAVATAAATDIEALDAAAVHKTGAETIDGPKNFTDQVDVYALAGNSIVATVLDPPAAPTVTAIGNDESVMWAYRIVAKLSDGRGTAASLSGSTIHGDQTLDATNKISLTWPVVPGAASYDVYRTAHGLSPATTGRIATVTTNSYLDTGAAGDSSVPPAQNYTGRVTGALIDNGGQVFNVLHPLFAGGAKRDGVTDDTAAFAAADLAAHLLGGTVYAPGGTYRVNNLLLKYKGMNFVGDGGSATILICDLDAACAIQLGEGTDFAGGFKGRIAGMRITRQPGTIDPATFGISAKNFDDGTLLEDVEIDRHGVGLKTSHGDNNYHLGLHLDRVWFSDCTIYCWAKDVAELFIDSSHFGRNGPEAVPPSVLLQFEGQTNDVRITKTQFLPRTVNSQAKAFHWINTPNPTTGVYHLFDVNIENALTGFSSISVALLIQSLYVTGSRLTPRGKLFDFDPATLLVNLCFFGNTDIAFLTPSAIAAARFSEFSHNFVSGDLTFNGGDWIVGANRFTTDVHFTGVFNALVLSNNKLAFNGSIPIVIDVSGASGNISMLGNIADAGTQPPAIVPGTLETKGALKLPAANGAALFSIDLTGSFLITVADNGFAQPFGNANNFAGLVLIVNLTSKNVALYLVGGGVFTKLVGQTGTDFTDRSGSSSAHTDVYVNFLGALELNNKTGAAVDYRIMDARLNTSQ